MPTQTKSRKDQIEGFVRSEGPIRRGDVARQFDLKDNYAGKLLSEMANAQPPRLRRVEEGLYDLPERVDDAQAQNLENLQTSQDTEGTISYALGRAGAGPGRTSDREEMTVDKKLIRSEIGHLPAKDQAFWTQVNGDSMSPWIQDGEYCLCLRQNEVDVPGRYVIWWGRHEADICCYLARMSETSLLLRKYGPEEEYTLHHQEDDVYEIPDGTTVRVRVQGRVIWPRSTAQSILETVTDKMGEMLSDALN